MSSPPAPTEGATRPVPGNQVIARHLAETIQLEGAISLSRFMRTALVSPLGGYYARGDVFGARGDFTTAPEVSQLFGEMLGVWVVSQWHKMGCPSEVELVELGPGRGTLMKDVLRVVGRFADMKSALRVTMVEASAFNEGQQKAALAGAGVPVTWRPRWDRASQGPPLIFLAQEVFAALPVCQFVMTERGWRERLVDVVDSDLDRPLFRFVAAPSMTNQAYLMLSTMAPDAGRAEAGPSAAFPLGSQIEICPDGLAIFETLCHDVALRGGCGLVVDYGTEERPKDSVRAIGGHTFHEVLDNPGHHDLSAWVHFGGLKAVGARSFEGAPEPITAYGPAPQGHFLRGMGIQARLQMLLKGANEAQAKALNSGLHRLCDDKEMGLSYKALAISRGFVPDPFLPRPKNSSSSKND
jgi:NADH dehydrogenase [ubiquinone] 1 alpha subcomplex assembly factor 7